MRPDGQRLRVSGIPSVINAAIPTLHQHGTEFIVYLHNATSAARHGRMSQLPSGQWDTRPATPPS